ncbi:hypothetical protein QUF58_13185 [Anaerolineales bacterium HSG24]|nr:hypothetical protein [Anaerolineales bacterium HSG24]
MSLNKVRQIGVVKLSKILYKSVQNHWVHYSLKRQGIQVGYHVTFSGKNNLFGTEISIGAYSRINCSYLDGRGALTIGANCIILFAKIFTATITFAQ